MEKLSSLAGLSAHGLAARIALMAVFILGPALSASFAEDVPGLTDSRSPLVFPPLFRAELTVRPAWVSLSNGKVTGDRINGSWGLKERFHLESNALFVDYAARVQTGRVSWRICLEQRNFIGEKHFKNDPGAPMGETRLTHPGLRIGGDVDFAQWDISRIGVNIDYDLQQPIFSEASETEGGSKLFGQQSLSLGIHGTYNPSANFCGITPILEFRARWAVLGTKIADMELAAGLRTPETVLGSMGLKVGYRHTYIEFNGAHRSLDFTLDGCFGELVYYY